jgi:hypothetical protein
MGPIGCPETSVQNYQFTLRNISEERRSHLHSGGSLKSRKLGVVPFIKTVNLLLYPEEGDSGSLRNVDTYVPNYTASIPEDKDLYYSQR